MKNFLDNHPPDWTNPEEIQRLNEYLIGYANNKPDRLLHLAQLAGIANGTFPENDAIFKMSRELIEEMALQRKLRTLVEVAAEQDTVYKERFTALLTLTTRPANKLAIAETPASSNMPAPQRRQFRQDLNTYFTISELQGLCFDLGIDYEQFPQNQGKGKFIESLVAFLERDNRLEQFLVLCGFERGHVKWPSITAVTTNPIFAHPSNQPRIAGSPSPTQGESPVVDAAIINLREALSRGDLAVFVGSQLSQMAGLPAIADVLRPLVSSSDTPLPPDQYLTSDHLLEAAETYEVDAGRNALVRRFIDAYQTVGVQPTLAHRLLAQLPVQAYFTTNYDNLLELAFLAQNRPCTPIIRNSNLPYASRDKAYIARLRGDVSQPDTLILTRQDVHTYAQNHPLLVNELRTRLVNTTFLFVGYDMTDPGFNLVQDQIGQQVGRATRLGYTVMMNASLQRQQRLRQRHIQVINLALDEGHTPHDQLLGWLEALL
ncbi:MAG: hypothetical protein CL609_07610 [Anaerolineaceae bacterium]|nr:hypothetical protein [Anaerolineaceae bacterium]